METVKEDHLVPEEDVSEYKQSALTSVKFKIAYNDKYEESESFFPEMAHQIFGESESIFGFLKVNIDIIYAHNSFKCLLKLNASGKIKELEADDILDILNPWLPENYVKSDAEFKKILKEENHNDVLGTQIEEFKIKQNLSLKKNLVFKVTQCDIKDEKFKELHQRFETLIIWYIDAANFIDLDDDRWEIFYVYEEFENESGQIISSPVGYCTAYKFFAYPDKIRTRISQFFVLPTHQKLSIGSNFYELVVKALRKNEEVVDITVEEPVEVFQKMRDLCDCKYILNDMEVNKVTLQNKHSKRIREYMGKHKICKKQGQRILDILEYYNALKSGPQSISSFCDSIKQRITCEIERELKGSKRIFVDNGSVSVSLPQENVTDTRYSTYINEIKPIAKKLLER